MIGHDSFLDSGSLLTCSPPYMSPTCTQKTIRNIEFWPQLKFLLQVYCNPLASSPTSQSAPASVCQCRFQNYCHKKYKEYYSPVEKSPSLSQATLPNPKGCPCHPPPWIITIIRFYEDIDLNRRKSVSRWSPTKKWNSRQTYLKCRPSENLELWALKLTFFGHFWLSFFRPQNNARTLVWATPTLCLLWTRPREAEGLFWIWKQVSNTLSMISAQSS